MPLCTPEKIKCFNKLKIDGKDCFNQCSGLLVTSYDEEFIKVADTKNIKNIKKLTKDYWKYKGFYKGTKNSFYIDLDNHMFP